MNNRLTRAARAAARRLTGKRDPFLKWQEEFDATPPAPEGVRMRRGGETIPVEVVYSGRRPDGTAVFTVPGARLLPGDQLQVAVLPAMTTIVIDGPGPRK